jgi:hypothetical protein
MGVLLFKGMKSGIQGGDLSVTFHENGSTSSNLIISTSYNILPLWLKIAYDNLLSSQKANKLVSLDWCDDAEKQKSLLIAELTPSIQVFVACACALDALYDQLKEHTNITREEIDNWKEKRTARHSQIVEVIRRSYKLDKHLVKAAKLNIKSIMDYRDKVVHSSHEIKHTCTRPDIPVSVDWRFSAYKYTNALIAWKCTVELFTLLYDKKSQNEKVNENMESIIEALIEFKLVTKNA